MAVQLEQRFQTLRASLALPPEVWHDLAWVLQLEVEEFMGKEKGHIVKAMRHERILRLFGFFNLTESDSKDFNAQVLFPSLFGETWRAISKEGTHIAIKVSRLENAMRKRTLEGKKNVLEDLFKEAHYLAKMKFLQGEGVLYLLPLAYFFVGSKFVLTVTPLLEGDLLAAINSKPTSQIKITLRMWVKQLALAIDTLHKNHIVHLDISPENILYTKDRKLIKLMDFGTARDYEEGKLYPPSYVGKKSYMAPEIRIGQTFDGRAADIYSFGATIYTLFFRKFIEHEHDKKQASLDRLAVEVGCEDVLDTKLLSEMLLKEAKERPTSAAILESKWMIGVDPTGVHTSASPGASAAPAGAGGSSGSAPAASGGSGGGAAPAAAAVATSREMSDD